MDGHMSRVYALKFHPSDTKILLSGGWDDTVQFWDTRQRHSIRYVTIEYKFVIVNYSGRSFIQPHLYLIKCVK